MKKSSWRQELMIVKRLREIREKLGYKQYEMAEKLNLHFSSYGNYERGEDTITLTNLIKFSNITNYSLDYLLGISNINIKYEKIKNIDFKKIGNNLKQLRKEYDYTQEYIAKSLNCAISTYCYYEQGRSLTATAFLFELKNIYPNFSADKLLNRNKQ